jgi:hypothetical protein
MSGRKTIRKAARSSPAITACDAEDQQTHKLPHGHDLVPEAPTELVALILAATEDLADGLERRRLTALRHGLVDPSFDAAMIRARGPNLGPRNRLSRLSMVAQGPAEWPLVGVILPRCSAGLAGFEPAWPLDPQTSAACPRTSADVQFSLK